MGVQRGMGGMQEDTRGCATGCKEAWKGCARGHKGGVRGGAAVAQEGTQVAQGTSVKEHEGRIGGDMLGGMERAQAGCARGHPKGHRKGISGTWKGTSKWHGKGTSGPCKGDTRGPQKGPWSHHPYLLCHNTQLSQCHLQLLRGVTGAAQGSSRDGQCPRAPCATATPCPRTVPAQGSSARRLLATSVPRRPTNLQ